MKNITELFFVLNKNERIIIQLPVSIDIISACDDVIIKFIHNDNNIMLANDCFLHVLRQLKSKLKLALGTKLFLHDSITQDIGLMWNKMLYGDKAGLVFEKHENQDFWVGNRYLLWSTPGSINPSLSTWLYNDQNGNIILHITPEHKDIFTISRKKFDKWMKAYEPFLIKVISQNTAHIWLDQVNELLEIIEKI